MGFRKKIAILTLCSMLSCPAIATSKKVDTLVKKLETIKPSINLIEGTYVTNHIVTLKDQIIDGHKYEEVYIAYSASPIRSPQLIVAMVDYNILPTHIHAIVDGNYKDTILDGKGDFSIDSRITLFDLFRLYRAKKTNNFSKFLKYFNECDEYSQKLYEIIIEKHS